MHCSSNSNSAEPGKSIVPVITVLEIIAWQYTVKVATNYLMLNTISRDTFDQTWQELVHLFE